MFILQTGGENSFIAINKEEGYYAVITLHSCDL